MEHAPHYYIYPENDLTVQLTAAAEAHVFNIIIIPIQDVCRPTGTIAAEPTCMRRTV